jgi:nucleoside-diphosphate-sugar epimerase
MRSLVTGASGFVGLALVRRLLADGDSVRALTAPGDRRLPELRGLASAGQLDVVEADVTDEPAVGAQLAGIERVFHVAALVHGTQPWSRFRAINVGGTQHVARAAQAAGVQRFVHVSTSDVFGIPKARGNAVAPVFDETTPYGYWQEPYPDTKIEAEQWLWQFRRESGLPLSIIYPCWVYGPGDQALFPGFAQALKDGLLVLWQRNTAPAWVHIDNLVDAIVLAGSDPRCIGEGYLVHDAADGPTLEQVCARLAEILAKPFAPRYVPYGVAFAAAAAAQMAWRSFGLKGAPPILTNDVKSFGHRWRFSNAKLRALGWTPRIGIDAGMQQAFDYFRTLPS